MSTFRVYLRLVRVQARAQLQYRTSFALSLAGTFLFTTLDFAAILIIFTNLTLLAGWTAAEVSLLYAGAAMSFALADMVLGSLDRLPAIVRDGTFDLLLLRPRSAFFQLLASDFMLRRGGRLIQASAVLAVVLTVPLDIDWTPARALVLVTAIASGAVILGAIWVVAACLTFRVVEAGEFVNTFTTGSSFLAQYPMSIFGAELRRVVLFIVPIGFVIYLPATYVLGKPTDVGVAGAARFASPLVAVVTALLATRAWRSSVRHYQSAGG